MYFLHESSVMRMTAKKLAQGAVIVLLIACYALLTVHDRSASLQDASPSVADANSFQVLEERVARSVPSDAVQRQVLTFNKLASKSEESDFPPEATAQGNSLSLEDIFISVKTTKKFHKSRLDLILRTWFNLARQQTFFFSDYEDRDIQEKTNGHLINTNCSSSHNRKALCCKMSVEFDVFLTTEKKWFCHFDDDNYVNIPRLVDLLKTYKPSEEWYLGKPSIRRPLEILDRETGKEMTFWFATGGAGFCLSRSLALKMQPIASGGKFISIGDKIRLPDDVTVGYIVEHLLGKNLTVIEQFHSHLEPMKFIKPYLLHEQITFSYSKYGQDLNVVPIENGIDTKVDPTRFLSLHCKLFPNFNFCPK